MSSVSRGDPNCTQRCLLPRSRASPPKKWLMLQYRKRKDFVSLLKAVMGMEPSDLSFLEGSHLSRSPGLKVWWTRHHLGLESAKRNKSQDIHQRGNKRCDCPDADLSPCLINPVFIIRYDDDLLIGWDDPVFSPFLIYGNLSPLRIQNFKSKYRTSEE